jgi:hypothetical protein
MADHSVAEQTYPPLNTLKPVAAGLWIVDGPLIRFGLPFLKMPFPTRMTMIRLGGGGLFIHSPTALTQALREEIARIGQPRWIVAPNRLHYWWIAQWHAAFPGAGVYLAPHIRGRSAGRIDFDTRELSGNSGYPWDRELETLAVAGSYMTEFVFFHRASRTLVLTDLIENFERQKLPLLMRWLTKLGGVQDPHGGMPRDMRATFSAHTLKPAIQAMIGWNPERIILAHGRWYEANGAAELRRAFASVLR